MSDELTPAERFAHEEEYVFVPRDLSQGVSEDEIVAKLARLEWDPAKALAYVRQFQVEQQLWQGSPEERQGLVQHYYRQMLMGALLAGAGLLVTVLTFLVAIGHGGIFVGLFGLIAVGLFMLVNGSSKWRLYRRDPDEGAGT
jgi:hypothetical protein